MFANLTYAAITKVNKSEIEKLQVGFKYSSRLFGLYTIIKRNHCKTTGISCILRDTNNKPFDLKLKKQSMDGLTLKQQRKLRYTYNIIMEFYTLQI